MAITLRPYQTESVQAVLNEWERVRSTLLISATGTGKCLAHDEPIFLANGRVITAGELVGRTVEVVGVTDTDTMQQVPVSATFSDNGMRDVYEVHLDNGTVLRRTSEHPLWAARMEKYATLEDGPKRRRGTAPTNAGWEKTSKIEVTGTRDTKGDMGHVVLVPRSIAQKGDMQKQDGDVFLCALMLAEGNLTTNSVRFSTASRTMITSASRAVERYGCEVKQYDSHQNGYDYHIVSGIKYRTNEVRRLMVRWMMWGKSAYDKEIPRWVFQLPDRQVALFLRTMIDCDGWFECHKHSNQSKVCIALANEQMVKQISYLALRLGIPGRIRHRKTQGAGAWEWATTEVETWAERIGTVDKKEALALCLEKERARKAQRSTIWNAWRTAQYDADRGIANCPDGYEWRKVKKVVHVGKEPTVSITVHNDNHAYIGLAVEHNTEMMFGVLAEERKRCIEAGEPFRVVELSHTSELVQQPRDRIALNWRGKLPVPGIVQANVNECDAEIICATVQTLDARRASKQFPTFSASQKTKGEQRFIEADTADKNLQLFDEFGDPIQVKVPKAYESAVDPRNCRYVYSNGAPVMTDNFERANFENYMPYAGRFEPKHGENDFISVETIATGRRLRAVLEENLGYWKFVYEDTDKPYTVPESKAHPLRQFKRLREILQHGKITHLVIDEAHHSPAASYQRIIRALVATNPDLRILGVTATPERSDEIKMSAVFDSVAYRIDLFRAIYLLRCLCKYERVGVALPVDASKIMSKSSRKDDFTQSELAELGEILSQHDALHIVVDTWEQEAADRRSIFYTATVSHAQALCEIFQTRGHAAAFVSGETPKTEREEIVKRFRSGELQVLTNCSVFSEGVDVPEISCVGMVRPTKSKTFYTQCAGRGLRNHPTKDALDPPCLIIDFVPQNSPQDLRMASDILGNRNEQIAQVRKAKEESAEPEIIEMLNEMESSLIQGEIVDVLAEGRQKRDVVIKRFDFFKSESPLDWYVDSTIATASIAREHIMAVVSPQLDRLETAQELIQSGNWKPEWDAHLDKLRSYQLYAINGNVELVQIYTDWEDAKKAAQIYSDEHTDTHIGHAKASWRERPPSAKQMQRAREAGVEGIKSFLRAGDLSKAIAHAEAQAALKRAKVIK